MLIGRTVSRQKSQCFPNAQTAMFGDPFWTLPDRMPVPLPSKSHGEGWFLVIVTLHGAPST